MRKFALIHSAKFSYFQEDQQSDSPVLLYAETYYVPHSRCAEKYNRGGLNLNQGVICTQSDNQGACQVKKIG